jgi:hypothetical protein
MPATTPGPTTLQYSTYPCLKGKRCRKGEEMGEWDVVHFIYDKVVGSGRAGHQRLLPAAPVAAVLPSCSEGSPQPSNPAPLAPGSAR